MTYFTKDDDGNFIEVTDKLVPETDFLNLKAKNNELRATNTNLLKSNQDLSAFADVLGGVQNITPENLKTKIDQQASQRAEAMLQAARAKYEEENTSLKTELQNTSGHYSKLLLGSEVQKAGSKHGVVATAYDDVLRRAEDAFTIKDGKVIPKDELARDANGAPLSVEAWMENQAKAAPHLFAQAKGPALTRNVSTSRVAVEPSAGRSAQDLLMSGLSKRK